MDRVFIQSSLRVTGVNSSYHSTGLLKSDNPPDIKMKNGLFRSFERSLKAKMNTCSILWYDMEDLLHIPVLSELFEIQNTLYWLHAMRAEKENTMKKELTDLLQKGYQAEKDFIATLSEEERKEVGTFENWTAKDNVAHNAYWRKSHAEDVLEVLAGKSPNHVDDDEINEEVYSQYKDQSWDEIDALIETNFERMGEALSKLGEDDLQSDKFYPWEQRGPLWREIVGNIYTHVILHLSDWHIKREDTTRAAELYQEMTGRLVPLDDSPDWQGNIRYNNACSFSLLGDKETAINELREALKLNPGLTEWSKEDPDFEPIRGETGYKALYD
jgi:hypothetical protein